MIIHNPNHWLLLKPSLLLKTQTIGKALLLKIQTIVKVWLLIIQTTGKVWLFITKLLLKSGYS